MGMVVNNNIPALFSFNAVTKTGNALQKSIQKLSTGLRINSAADDAAGLAISEKMRAQIRGLDRAVSNSQDGISMIQTAEGALNETHSILQRMRELSVQSANDTLTQQDRGYIQLEIDQLREEITRIGNTTQFNKKKLLDGSAAVLWSSDNLKTKAIVNGGLRQVDQFGQKRALEGNYNLKIKAEAGQAEVKKSDIFKVKHKDVLSIKSKDVNLIKDISVKNLKPGVIHNVGVGAATAVAIAPAIVAKKIENANAFDGLFKVGTAGTDGATYEVAVTVKDRLYTADNAQANVTLEIKGFKLGPDGTRTAINQTVTLASEANGTAGANDVDVAGIGGFKIDKDLTAADKIKDMAIGDKLVFRMSNAMATPADGRGIDVSYDNGAGLQKHQFNVSKDVLTKNGTMNLSFLNLDEKTGEVTESSITMKFNDKKLDGSDVAFADFAANKALGSFKTYAVGDVARGDVKLRDLEKFWDAQGRFMLTDPQTITITQGDGKQTKITLYANDTLDDLATKLNKAIGSDLGQNSYVDKVDYFSTFVTEAAGGNTSESVAGTLLIRSVVAGAAGKLSLAGDEDLIKALSLNVIQDAKESNYTVDISNAHTGETVVSGAKTTGNKLIGVLHSNIDVEFDAMAGISANWDDTNKLYAFNPSKEYNTVLHLADNTTVFQIGANEGEDMGINIGDMRSHALGLNEVLVTDRASAARSITIIDNAIDKVSTQRAKLGAYQNRLEHTINNLTVAGENLTAAESRIRDTDMAKEMMNFTKLNIMLQAGNAMLAQANQLPQGVLSLIR